MEKCCAGSGEHGTSFLRICSPSRTALNQVSLALLYIPDLSNVHTPAQQAWRKETPCPKLPQTKHHHQVTAM